ncbi:hypothetical protein [Actinoallomurus iriomotensis]|uniref:Lipoprotein n=1 Tax=Actinoallomurus iriomotensis TaxID=478107 RepID=A0A9W6VIW9_9ACTN|nr:hypothetical protein [Actinoallomurus iriomotensis]GLY73403.1 hypothetical protein Airi01_016700 [Actinoallomurus iriomotensis]
MFRKSLKTAVCALAAGTALAACGPVQPGAAAIVGHDRISVSKVDSAANQWAKELPHYPQAGQIVAAAKEAQRQQAGQQAGQQQGPYDPSSPQRSVLYKVIQIRLWDEVAREQHVSTAPGQVDAFIASQGGQQSLDAYVVAQGLPTSYDEDYARSVLIQRTMLQRYGVNPDQPVDQQQGQQVLQRLAGDYANAKRHVGITVNPRFGEFDDQTISLGPVCPHLSTPDSGTPDAAGEIKCQL